MPDFAPANDNNEIYLPEISLDYEHGRDKQALRDRAWVEDRLRQPGLAGWMLRILNGFHDEPLPLTITDEAVMRRARELGLQDPSHEILSVLRAIGNDLSDATAIRREMDRDVLDRVHHMVDIDKESPLQKSVEDRAWVIGRLAQPGMAESMLRMLGYNLETLDIFIDLIDFDDLELTKMALEHELHPSPEVLLVLTLIRVNPENARAIRDAMQVGLRLV